ncbi:MXAN_2562 family outer membrane beta-barrel protein [Stigmatella sp. ncwal1]|uniref:MXAN_2562 family outer membrane beta-barrel protein n=1 Tax=Stigmatella ashevillensis TaxID=2995309 RepID=A0ABT5DMR1_9BACT|nr:MXAN_2562 family outer membrane beta-barrel protein [Stigmatella ashevillena]MDC0714944.1 MXAN_2562 family outer membrane beta-barrel protein [Stigmatella ashevillena]
MSRAVALGVAAFLGALPSLALEVSNAPSRPIQSPRTGAVEVKLGGYKPRIDTEEDLKDTPYADTFGDSSMLLVELEIQRYFYQGIGSAGLSVSAGYAEKYGDAVTLEGEVSPEKTSLKVVPLRLNALYKFDYAAFRWHVPLVPYAKAGLIYTPWWTSKGANTQEVNGRKGKGGRWGYGLTAGVSFLMDVLEPRLARDFDSDLGINHTYLFAEYTYAEVNNFGSNGLVLSSRHWMFGLSLDY